MERDRVVREVYMGERIPMNRIHPHEYREMFNALRSGRIAGQKTLEIPEHGFNGEIILYTNTPELTPEQQHLQRTEEVKGGVLPLFVQSRIEEVNSMSTDVNIIANQDSPKMP